MDKEVTSSPTQTNGVADPMPMEGIEKYFSEPEAASDHEESKTESEAVSDSKEIALSQNQTTSESGEAESSADSEEELHDEDEDEVDDEPSSAKELEYPKFRKRVSQLTKQKHELRDKIAKLTSRIEELEKAEPKQEKPSSKADPIESINTLEEVDAEFERASGVIDWCDANEDGAVVVGKSGEQEELDADEIKNIRRNAERMMRRLPKRIKLINQRAAVDQIAQESYPWLRDAKSREFLEAQAVLAAFPELSRIPEASIVLGDLIEGRKARQAKSSKKQVPSAQRIAPTQPSVSAAPSKVPQGDAKAAEAYASFAKSGGREDELARLFQNYS